MASAKAYVTIRLPLRTRKRLAALMVIRERAAAICTEQPWNDDAKKIRQMANLLLGSCQHKGGA